MDSIFEIAFDLWEICETGDLKRTSERVLKA
jgi:hypothetical protein